VQRVVSFPQFPVHSGTAEAAALAGRRAAGIRPRSNHRPAKSRALPRGKPRLAANRLTSVKCVRKDRASLTGL